MSKASKMAMPIMTYEYIDALTERIEQMTEEERKALDPIAQAVEQYLRRERPPMFVLPTRIVALACVDVARAYQEIAE